VLTLLIVTISLADIARGEPVKLKIQSGYGLNVPVLGDTIKHFEQRVATSGRTDIRVRLYDAGKLVPPLQIFDAVTAGKIDAGFLSPFYWMGKIPAATVFSAIPFGPEPAEFLAWLHQGGGLEIWRKLYARHGAVPLPCGVLPPEASGWFTKPIETEEDLRGLKIRYAGLGGRVLEKMGASITMLAAGDIFMSLERGVIDATEYSMPAVDRALGFHKVAKHYYFPGWHQPASILELIVNKERWDAMSPEQRNYLEMACDATTLWGLTRGLAIQGEALAFYEAEGVTIQQWSPQMLARFRELSKQVMEEASNADPDFAEAWNSLQAFRAKNRNWSSIAYSR
jgi:TRAP-type mannitol/chloroaromatic compound transport system substrate-binding protein